MTSTDGPQPRISAREVVRRLKSGDKLRMGYTMTHQGYFDNGGVVTCAILRNLELEGLIHEDADGTVTLKGYDYGQPMP
jgi:hypothetical protein